MIDKYPTSNNRLSSWAINLSAEGPIGFNKQAETIKLNFKKVKETLEFEQFQDLEKQ